MSDNSEIIHRCNPFERFRRLLELANLNEGELLQAERSCDCESS